MKDVSTKNKQLAYFAFVGINDIYEALDEEVDTESMEQKTLVTLHRTLEEWIKNLPLADTNVLMNRIDLINSQIGVNLEIESECKVCGTEYLVPFYINQTFFRPRS